jgi:hypothetical protein
LFLSILRQRQVRYKAILCFHNRPYCGWSGTGLGKICLVCPWPGTRAKIP